MKTPITDEATSDCICNSCEGRDVVPRKVAVALELDRAALMELVESYVENGQSLPLTQRAIYALSAARANFP